MTHSLFMPHGWCMTWNPWLIGLHVVTDAAVALSYYSIPLALCLIAWKRRMALKLEPILLLFACFIALCGGGHAIDIVSIWKPIYWVKGFWNLGTAVASVVTAIVLIPRTIGFINMPGRAEKLEREATELREHSSLLGTVLDAVEEAILLLDASGRVLLRNRAANEMLPGDVSEWTVSAGGAQGLWTSPDGRQVERFTTAVPAYGQLYLFRDLTEQLQTEQARLRLEHIIGSMKPGFEVVSLPEERIIQTNPSFEAMLGANSHSLVDRRADSIFAGTAEEQQRVFRAIREKCEQASFWEGETRQATETGEELWCSSRFNLHEESGQRFLSAIHHDITEEKRVAEESARMEARLQEAAKLESLGVLAGGVAHDFNNLLVGILGNSSLAMDTISTNSPARRMLQDVVSASESAAKLTRQLLAYAGKGRFLIEPVDMSDLVRQISSLVQTSIPKTVQLRLDLAYDLPCIEGGCDAITATGDESGDQRGGGDWGAERRGAGGDGYQDLDEQYIASVLAPEEIEPGRYVTLEVHDTGVGMSPDDGGAGFSIRSSPPNSRAVGLVWRRYMGIVRGHQGRNARCTARWGRVRPFKVLFPATDEERLPAPKPPAAVSERGAKAILVIDDEQFVRTTAKSMLEQLRVHGIRSRERERRRGFVRVSWGTEFRWCCST